MTHDRRQVSPFTYFGKVSGLYKRILCACIHHLCLRVTAYKQDTCTHKTCITMSLSNQTHLPGLQIWSTVGRKHGHHRAYKCSYKHSICKSNRIYSLSQYKQWKRSIWRYSWTLRHQHRVIQLKSLINEHKRRAHKLIETESPHCDTWPYYYNSKTCSIFLTSSVCVWGRRKQSSLNGISAVLILDYADDAFFAYLQLPAWAVHLLLLASVIPLTTLHHVQTRLLRQTCYLAQ